MKFRLLLLLSFILVFSTEAFCQLPKASQQLENSIKERIKKSSDPIEGIYKTITGPYTPYYRIGIYREGDLYRAVSIEAKSKRWRVGDTKAFFEPIGNLRYSVKWSMADKGVEEVFARINEDGQLEILFSNPEDNIHLIKLFPQKTTISEPPQRPKENVKIPAQNEISSGTGFFISKQGYIATNYHVINGATSITIDLSGKDNQSNQYAAVLVRCDPTNDIAVLRIVDPEFSPFQQLPYIIESKVNVGASVFTIGFPLNNIMGKNFKVSNGIISAKTGINDDVRYYQITVPVQPGSSGGPLFNKDGNIVGITSSQLNGDYIGAHIENVNYAIKTMYLLNVIDLIPDIEELPSDSALAGLSLEDQVEVLKNYICLIRVY